MIQAAADKLKREMEDFGFPPVFPVTDANEEVEVEVATPKENENKVDNKSKGKKVFFFLSIMSMNRLFSCWNRVKQQRRVVVKNINGK